MKRQYRILIVLLATGLAAAVGGTVSYGAFSASTTNPANEFASGTVALEDNDTGTSMLSLTTAVPGATDTSCIHVTYTGSLDSAVRLSASVTGTLAPHLTLTVTRGTDATPTFDSCSAFTADTTDHMSLGPGVVYSGPLSGYPAAAASGIVDPDTWSTGDAHDYRFAVTLDDNDAAQGQSASATFRWEARNL